ncbi:MAG: M55 family metallopeptidase [Candidatus Odinarchaeota archaeon]
MKAFISVDLEGMPHVITPGHLWLKGSLYDEARKIATKVTLAVVEKLHENGFDEILIADSHGPMVNLLVEDLPEYVEIIRGSPRPASMVAGVEECDAALFLGYHAKAGTAKSAFDHTYSGRSIHQLEINGEPASEFLLNAYTAGEFNVPVILVAGDAQLLEDDVKKHAPWVETVILKRSLTRIAARSRSMVSIEKDLKEKVRKAVSNFKANETKLLVTEKPVKTLVSFKESLFADAAELLPIIKRIDGLNVEYTASNMVEAYKIFQLLVIAASGLSSYLTALQ